MALASTSKCRVDVDLKLQALGARHLVDGDGRRLPGLLCTSMMSGRLGAASVFGGLGSGGSFSRFSRWLDDLDLDVQLPGTMCQSPR